MATKSIPDVRVLALITAHPGSTHKEILAEASKQGYVSTSTKILQAIYRLRDEGLITLDSKDEPHPTDPNGLQKVLRAFPVVITDLQKGTESTETPISKGDPQRISAPPARLMAPAFELPEYDTIEDARAWIKDLLQRTSEVKTFDMVVVTPNRARACLEYNTRNRNLSQTRAKKYSEIIARGEWIVTTDDAGFDTVPKLIQGQHRFNAIIIANMPAIMGIKINLPEGTSLVLDGGLPRRNKDTLKTELDLDHGGSITATANWISMYKKGLPRSFSGSDSRLDQIEIVDFTYNNQAILEAAQMGALVWKELRKALVKPIGGAAYFLMREIDPVQAEEFFYKLRTGTNLQSDDPVYVLREKLMDRAGDFHEAGVSGSNMCPQLALVIHAWNRYREGWRGTKLPIWRKDKPFPVLR